MPEKESAKAAVDAAFEVLKTYDYAGNRGALKPIDDAIVAALGKPAARDLERRLTEVLKSEAPAVAKDYACRKLELIGSAESVPALADLLGDEKLSILARGALERIAGPEPLKALREALPKLEGLQKAGALTTLGTRRDAECVPALAALLKDSDAQIAAASIAALGRIGNSEAGKALRDFQPSAAESLRSALADASLECAEHLLRAGKRDEALAIYRSLIDSQQPEYIRLAAKRGLSAAERG